MDEGTILILFLIVGGSVIGYLGFKKLKPNESGVIDVFGRVWKEVGPGGWHFVPPLIGHLTSDFSGERQLSLRQHRVPVSDGKGNKVDVDFKPALSFEVASPRRAFLDVEGPEDILAEAVYEGIRVAAADSTLDNVLDLSERPRLRQSALQIIISAARRLGLRITQFNFSDISLPVELDQAMREVKEAQLKGDALKLEAQGRADAAKIEIAEMTQDGWQESIRARALEEAAREGSRPIVMLGGGGSSQDQNLLAGLLGNLLAHLTQNKEDKDQS